MFSYLDDFFSLCVYRVSSEECLSNMTFMLTSRANSRQVISMLTVCDRAAHRDFYAESI